ncbi:hypothetical protein COMA1_40102 [Candidatus Nitrospira nitrosa]|uniref:Uncharacterized protein n=1 Tax=Candidatus Nitrospira nitrosa TaxID=1742972 RepID=A0A0S4LNL7_9BACT|nr:hypothetical protein COMA1_40102 [Candidatus Nitrospira nitrosa]
MLLIYSSSYTHGDAGFCTIPSESRVRNSDIFGILKLILHPTGYEWEFLPEAGKTFVDKGKGRCH